MKVAILLNRLWGGGAERVGLGWADGLSARGHDVVVLQYDPRADERAVRPRHARVLSFDGGDRLRRWHQLPRWVRRTAEQERPDAIVSLLTFPNLVLLRALLGQPDRPALVITEHNVLPAFLQAEGRGGRAKDVLARRLYRYADLVGAPSHAVAACVLGGYGVPRDRLAVIPNPVLLSPAPVDAEPHTAPRLLLVGRVEAQKRPHLLVPVLQELARRGDVRHGRLIGDGSLRGDVLAAARAAGVEVDCSGWVDRWQDEVGAGDVLLLPSDMEGFGNVLVEAAGAGVPVVACSESLGVSDAVLPGVTGELAAAADPASLADAVQRASRLRPSPDLLAGWLHRYSEAGAAQVLEDVLVRAVRRRQSRR